MAHLLSVDWDYFFPVPYGTSRHFGESHWLYDWGQREEPFFYDQVWPIRAASFLVRDLTLPNVDMGWKTFWEGIQFSADAELFIADSHAAALSPEVMHGVTKITNYDAHHDCGYGGDAPDEVITEVDAGNWLRAARERHHVGVVQRYPPWRDKPFDAEPPAPDWLVWRKMRMSPTYDVNVYDRVFICRSSAWVPPWCDQEFGIFFRRCPVFLWRKKATVLLSDVDPRIPRAFDLDTAQKLAVQEVEARDLLKRRVS